MGEGVCMIRRQTHAVSRITVGLPQVHVSVQFRILMHFSPLIAQWGAFGDGIVRAALT